MRIARLVLSILPLAACVTPAETHMHSVDALDPDPRPDVATIIFARAPSPCDEGSPFIVMDEGGHFLGESAPGTKFSYRIPPGRHTFVTWQPYGELRSEKYPNMNQVGAVSGTFDAGRWYVVDVHLDNSPTSTRNRCATYAWLGMRLVNPSRDEEFAMALAAASPVEADRAAGQAELNAEPEEIQRHLDMGRAKLAAHTDR